MQQKKYYFFQKILSQEFEKYTSRKDIRTSMRSFALLLGVNSGTLFQVLKGQRGLSAESAHCIVKNLKLHPNERNLFLRSLADFKIKNPPTQDLRESEEIYPKISFVQLTSEGGLNSFQNTETFSPKELHNLDALADEVRNKVLKILSESEFQARNTYYISIKLSI